jgi:hypothetical protein
VDEEVRAVSEAIGPPEDGISMNDPNAAVGSGWVRLGKRISPKAGRTKAEIPLDGLLRGKAGTWPVDEDFPPLRAPAVTAAYDKRYLYPHLARAALGPELSVA